MSFYHLVRYTQDPELKKMYLAAFHWYWTLEQPERNPFFHFAYAAVGTNQSMMTTTTLMIFPLGAIGWKTPWMREGFPAGSRDVAT